ncbi:hypothetical protein PFISCL1PPCAC_17955, partial [Pristionchus fissidentatus]
DNVQELSIFEHLPEELFWKIIDYVPESVRILSQTSRNLRYHVLHYVSMPARIEIIENLFCEFETHYDDMKITMSVSYHKTDLFEMRLEAILFSNGFSPERIQRRKHKMKEYTFECIPGDLETNLRNVSICIGARPQTSSIRGRIDVVELYHHHEEHKREYYKTLLEGINFDCLSLDFGRLKDDDAEFTRKLIVEHNVDYLDISFQQAAYDPQAFLLEVSSLVRSIFFTLPQLDDEDTEYYEYNIYSYGMQDTEWVPLVNEMFGEGKKLDKFCIENSDQPSYFSSDCIRQFTENLPFLGKRICFMIECNPTEEELSATVINDHVIRG